MATISCSLSQGGGRSDIPTNTGQSTADPINHNGGTFYYLFRPNLSGITAGSTINSASLRLYSEVAFNGGVLSVYDMLRAWVSGETSWNNYASGSGWNTAGASGSGTDRSASTIGTYTLTSSEDAQSINGGSGISISASAVQGWLDGTNNGMGLFSDGSVFADLSGVSDGTNPPILFVDYTEPSTGFTLTADAGTYTLTGQSATTSFASILTAAQGSYTLTGVAALLVRTGSYQFTAEAGAYTLVGANALVDVSMNASSGTYTLTGQAATLTFGSFSNPSLTADAGAYALTGFAANINYGRIMPAEVGAYTLTGRQVGLTWSGAPVATGYASQKMTISSLRISL